MNLKEAIEFALEQMGHAHNCPVTYHRQHIREVMSLRPGATGRRFRETQAQADARRSRMRRELEDATPACKCGYAEAKKVLSHVAGMKQAEDLELPNGED